MIEGKELHNLLSEIIGYKLIVEYRGYPVKTYPMFYINDMYDFRDYLDTRNLGVYNYKKIEDVQSEHYEVIVRDKIN